MNSTISLFSIVLMLISTQSIAQTQFEPHHVGYTFDISLPDYMTRTVGLNSSSSYEFQNEDKEIYGIIVNDNKEEMALIDIKFSSIDDFFDDFSKDFLKDEDQKAFSKPQKQKNEDTQIIETDVILQDKESKIETYYFIGIVETQKSFYTILCWSQAEDKDTYKADFQKIVHSLKD